VQKARFDWLGVLGLLILASLFYGVSLLAGSQLVLAVVGLVVIGLVLWGWLRIEKRKFVNWC
jgi:hypothetical protein